MGRGLSRTGSHRHWPKNSTARLHQSQVLKNLTASIRPFPSHAALPSPPQHSSPWFPVIQKGQESQLCSSLFPSPEAPW